MDIMKLFFPFIKEPKESLPKVTPKDEKDYPECNKPSTPIEEPEVPLRDSGFKWSKRSLDNMKGVHEDLVKVANLALKISEQDFMVIEGLRSLDRQKMLVRKGASKTMNSRHLTGHALDVVPVVDGKVSWDWNHYWAIEEAMKEAARILKVDIEWGGDWTSFKDGPHWQLPWSKYPA